MGEYWKVKSWLISQRNWKCLRKIKIYYQIYYLGHWTALQVHFLTVLVFLCVFSKAFLSNSLAFFCEPVADSRYPKTSQNEIKYSMAKAYRNTYSLIEMPEPRNKILIYCRQRYVSTVGPHVLRLIHCCCCSIGLSPVSINS